MVSRIYNLAEYRAVSHQQTFTERYKRDRARHGYTAGQDWCWIMAFGCMGLLLATIFWWGVSL